MLLSYTYNLLSSSLLVFTQLGIVSANLRSRTHLSISSANASNHCDSSNFNLPPELVQEYSTTFNGAPGTVAGPPLETFATVAALKGGWAPGLRFYETPIAVRFTHLIDAMNWNCAAVYSDGWKDALTKEVPVVRVPSMPSSLQLIAHGVTDMHTSDNRYLCMASAWASVVQDWAPESFTSLNGVLTSLGFTNLQYGYDPEVEEVYHAGVTSEVLRDMQLNDLAESNCYSPQIMGAIIGRQTTEYAASDGYNMYGTLNKDGTPCEANCHRYTDPTGYAPVYTSRKFHWKPLIEYDGRGYETAQQHVTPHIGFTAKPAILSRDELDSRSAPNPKYSYDDQVYSVVDRLKATALNMHNEKELIEFFDDKIKVTFKAIEAVASYGTSFEQILNYVMGLTASEYDATLTAWKEKVTHDLVRPTTWIQDEMPEELFETYGGPFQGVQTIKGKNLDAWVRVMPHSEYVSGSGCICQAIKDFTDEWMALTDGQLGPGPNTYVTGQSIAVPLSTQQSIEAPFRVGSSKTEPDITPASNVYITMGSLTEMRNACGESRLNGGMHFAQSVTAAYELCEGIGTQGAAFALDLLGDSGW